MMKSIIKTLFAFICLTIGCFITVDIASAQRDDLSRIFIPIVFNDQDTNVSLPLVPPPTQTPRDSQIYALLGRVEQAFGQKFDNFLVTADNQIFVLVGQTVELERQIVERRNTMVKVWGRILPDNRSDNFTRIVVTHIQHVSELSPTQPIIQGWKTSYFSNQDLLGPALVVADHDTINFNWDLGSPHPDIGHDLFSIRFERSIEFSGGHYRFTMQADDGFRIWIDGKRVERLCKNGSGNTYIFNRYLEGKHDFYIEYYEVVGQANVRFEYERLSNPSGWTVSYFDNIRLAFDPVLAREEPRTANNPIDHTWGEQGPLGVSVGPDEWSACWIGEFYFEEGQYTFSANSDDGIRLYLDGNLLLDEWKEGEKFRLRAESFVAEGRHIVTVEYFEWVGPAQLRVWWHRRPGASIDVTR